MNGFIPTINGSASRALTRRTIRRGSSSQVYDAERSNDFGVRGSPNANNDDKRCRTWWKRCEGAKKLGELGGGRRRCAGIVRPRG
jgi:hypothetical protein